MSKVKNKLIGIDADITKVALTVMSYPDGERLDTISLKRKGKSYDLNSLFGLYQDVAHYLTANIRYSDIKMVAIEDYGTSRQHRLSSFKGEVLGSLKLSFKSKGIPVFFSGSRIVKKKKVYISKVMMSPSTIKKFFYGNGSMKKGKSNKGFLIAYKKFGLEFVDDDALDSFVIAELCRDILLTEEGRIHLIGRDLGKKEQDVVTKYVKDRSMEINGKIVREDY